MKHEDQPTDRFPAVKKNGDESSFKQPSGQNDIQQWIDEGIRKLDGRDVEGAIEIFKKVLRYDPDNILAYEKLTIAQSIKADENSIIEFMTIGRDCLKHKDWKGAADEFQAVLEIDPNHEEAAALLEQIKPYLEKEGQQRKTQALSEEKGTFFDNAVEQPTQPVEKYPAPPRAEQPRDVTPQEKPFEIMDNQFDDFSGDVPLDSRELQRNDTLFEKQIERAITLYEAGNLEKARELLKQLDEARPDNSQVSYYMEIVERKLDDAKSSTDQEKIERTFKEGMDFISKKNYSLALKRFEDVLKMKPNFRQAELMLEKTRKLLKSEEKFGEEPIKKDKKPSRTMAAKRSFSPVKFVFILALAGIIAFVAYYAVIRYPESKMENFMNQAEELFSNKDYEGALNSIAEVEKINPNHPGAAELKGSIYLAMNRSNDAVQALQKALSLSRNNPAITMKLGDAYAMMGKCRQAIREYLKLKDNSSYAVKINYKLGKCYRLLKDYDNAKNVLFKAIELNPDFSSSHLELARVYRELNNKEESEREYIEAIAKNPKFAEVYLELGKYYIEIGKFDAAIEILKQPLNWLKSSNREQAKVVSDFRFQLGKAYASLGKYDEAKEEFNKIILLLDEPRAYIELGRVYYKMKKNEPAILAWENALKLDPGNAEVYFYLGSIYFLRIHDYKRAIDYFQEAIRLNPRHAKAYANLGFVYFKLLKKREALDAWQKSLEIDPKQPTIQRKVKKLLKQGLQ